VRIPSAVARRQRPHLQLHFSPGALLAAAMQAEGDVAAEYATKLAAARGGDLGAQRAFLKFARTSGVGSPSEVWEIAQATSNR
jgi:hypothetical protein